MKIFYHHSRLVIRAILFITTINSLLHAQADNTEQILTDTVSSVKSTDTPIAYTPETENFLIFSKCKLTTVILPVGFSIRTAGFNSFNSSIDLNLRYKRIYGDISYEWDWTGDVFKSKVNENVTTLKNKSIDAYFRSFEIGAGYTFYQKSAVLKKQIKYFQVHAGFKSLFIPQVALHTDSNTRQLEHIQQYSMDTAVTLNTREVLFFLGPELFFIKNSNHQISSFNLYTDILNAPGIKYSPAGNDGNEYKDTLCVLEKKVFSVRVGLKVSKGLIMTKLSHSVQAGIFGHVEAGIYPGIHYVNAAFLTGIESNVKHILYDIGVNAGFGVYCMF
jgi:hypothetical protein